MPGPNRDPKLLHPRLYSGLIHVMRVFNTAGHPLFITEGVRSNERQDALYAQGRTAPGRIVTNAQAGESDHNPDENGLSRAVDVAFRPRSTASEAWRDFDPYSEDHPWEFIHAVAVSVGLETGAKWRKPDRPHIYLPRQETTS